MSIEEAKAARTELMQLLKNICESDSYAIGAILIDVKNDLVVLEYIKKTATSDVGPKGGGIELSGGLLGRLIPALKDLCSEGSLNLGEPFVSIVMAHKGTAIIYILSLEWVIVVFGSKGLSISYIVQQLAQSHSKIRALIVKAQLRREGLEEWGL